MSSGFSHVAVLGPGLMGASLLMALRESSPRTKLSVWARREEAADEIVKRGLADTTSADAAKVAANADAVVLCVPVDRMQEVAQSIAPHVGRDTLVTDVGSTKEKLTEHLEEVFAKDRNFVGCHPMCGSEDSGLAAARADLYNQAICVACPTSSTRQDLLAKAEELWQLAGCRVVKLSPAEHDRAAAVASHVPHVAAAALVDLVGGEPRTYQALCASGFRDTTRIAAGSPDLWSAILTENATAVAAALEKFEQILENYRTAIRSADREAITRMLREAADNRAAIFPGN
jgi:prephenate dehydrogenase